MRRVAFLLVAACSSTSSESGLDGGGSADGATVSDGASADGAPAGMCASGRFGANDVAYLGAFALPQTTGMYKFSYGGAAIAYDPQGGGSVILTGHVYLPPGPRASRSRRWW